MFFSKFLEESGEAKRYDAVWQRPKKIQEGKKEKLRQSRKKGSKQPKDNYLEEDEQKALKELDEYFIEIPPAVIEGLKAVGEEYQANTNILNMYAVNRLAAIAKMLQYCIDNSIDVSKFKEGRATQKIRAWHKMHRITCSRQAISHSSLYIAPYLDQKGTCYPLLEELEYILSLDLDMVTEEAERLKRMLFTPIPSRVQSPSECMLDNVIIKNKEIMEKILSKAEKEINLKSPRSEISAEIPAIKRRRKKLFKTERKEPVKVHCANDYKLNQELKINREIKIEGTKSPSANSETAQE